MKSPTQHTLKYFKDRACQCKVVERYIKHPGMRHGIRQDLWGADILIRQGALLMAIQTTSRAHHSDHVEKCINNPDVANWLGTGVTFYVYSWAECSQRVNGKAVRGSPKTWQPRITQLVLDNYE